MHKIIVFGGQGRTGSLVVQEALKAGHEVSAFVYSDNHSFAPHPNLRIIEGNARSFESVKIALLGHDIVINTIAPRLTDKKNYDISEAATANIIQGMQELGIKRYLGQSGAWATEQLKDASLPMRIGFMLVPMFRGIYGYKKKEDAIIKESGLDWTIVRCGLLTDKPPVQKIQLHIDRYKCGIFEIPKISRANVAKFHVGILDDEAFYGRCPIIFN